MKIGFHVGQVVFRGADLQQQWRDHLEQLRACRDAGFAFVSWGHHVLIHPFQHFQPIPVLARFAADAGAMDLVTGVLLAPFLNPVQLAEDLATLDHVCAGRLVVGLGLGHRPEELETAGATMAERAGRLEEALALMKRLWAEDEVTHHGRFYRLTGARPTARPCQRPYPRVWLAASTERAVRRAARLGHPFYALGTLSTAALARLLAAWREGLREHGHAEPVEVPVLREMYVAATREEAWRLARPRVAAKYEGYAQHGLPGVDGALAGGLDALMRDPFIVGSPEDCVETLHRHAAMGVTHVAVRLFWPHMAQAEVLRMIHLVGERVIPRCAAPASPTAGTRSPSA
ncbi:MAG TPA: LLM class flavin-dependent oxidoreductase [Candidatus Tectomicrobia bacterium]|nr:LLM class flavin-dependent oxidoreductase [Candidatus Tectomicrobia bacterium]